MSRRRRQPFGRKPVLVIGLVVGVLVMHGLGDPSMDHSGMVMYRAQMPHQTAGGTAGVTHGHDIPIAPASEMAMAAICAFAILALLDRVTRRGPRPTQRWTHPTAQRSR